MEIKDEQLIELLEGKNDPELQKAIQENHGLLKRYFELKEVLETIEDFSEVEIPIHIQQNVRQAIYDEQAGLQQKLSWWHVAAAVVILAVGFSLGRIGPSAPDNSSELIALKQEISMLREAAMASSLKRYSASDRILAVSKIEESEKQNDELLETLVTTLNSDESPNVRYAAMQALTNFLDNEHVRHALVKSLESQSDPLIQISLITILVEAQEKSARVPMKKLLENEETVPEVKQQAEIALQVLI